jgi:hypothetical protein
MNIIKHTATEIMSIGKAFAESGMFPDIKSAAQAIVKIQAGAELGIAPFAAMSGIHIIKGKPTIGAGIMASMVKASGKYNYRVVEQTDKKCSIDFSQGINDVRFFIDGERVAASTTFSVASATAGQNVQLMAQVQKASGTGVASLTIARVEAVYKWAYGA